MFLEKKVGIKVTMKPVIYEIAYYNTTPPYRHVLYQTKSFKEYNAVRKEFIEKLLSAKEWFKTYERNAGYCYMREDKIIKCTSKNNITKVKRLTITGMKYLTKEIEQKAKMYFNNGRKA